MTTSSLIFYKIFKNSKKKIFWLILKILFFFKKIKISWNSLLKNFIMSTPHHPHQRVTQKRAESEKLWKERECNGKTCVNLLIRKIEPHTSSRTERESEREQETESKRLKKASLSSSSLSWWFHRNNKHKIWWFLTVKRGKDHISSWGGFP